MAQSLYGRSQYRKRKRRNLISLWQIDSHGKERFIFVRFEMADILKNEELSKDVENEEDEEEVDGAEEIETKDPAKKKKKKKKKKKTG